MQKKEVVECLRRRDRQWTKQLREKNVPEATVPPPTETDSVPSTSCPSSPPTDHPAISTSSPTQDSAREGTTSALTSTGPDLSYIFSILPFSKEEIITTQQDDTTLSISTTTHQTNRITVHNHQGLLYRRIQDKRGQQRIQLVVPKALIQRTIQSLHERTTERHHSPLKTLLTILEVAWWPTVRKDVWRYVGDCKRCNVINHSPEPSRHCTSTPIIKRGRRNQQTERRASNAGSYILP
ncbi:U1 small nuclear ribonucleo C-like protein [Labeo rohita]|uniref:Gypsy retrotransposon integrase-like protein 1 n=1 Tax=Labeo rohita TaxID=84645 RepID=A0A498MRV0_LABRO|nr:U1 small nuclear ribonucleo C-like protein [Labeo rohita]